MWQGVGLLTIGFLAGVVSLSWYVRRVAKHRQAAAQKQSTDLVPLKPGQKPAPLPENEHQGPKEYVVIARGASALHIRADAPLFLDGVGSPAGPVKMQIQMRRANLSTFSKPVPMGIMIEVRGFADSLEAALSAFATAAQNMMPPLSIVGNATIDNLNLELGFDRTRGSTVRDFFQQFVLDERLFPVPRRIIDSALMMRVFRAVASHPENERLHRALANYHRALQFWAPGMEIPAAHSLWIGAECMTPVVLRSYLSANAISEDELMRSWGLAERKLVEPEVRRRLIFGGDDALYSTAKTAFDGYEHGFLAFPDIHGRAVVVRRGIASRLRHCIIEHLQLDADDRAALLAEELEKPMGVAFAKYLRGWILGKGDELAAADQEYPIVAWRTQMVEGPSPRDGDPEVQFRESLKVRLGPGLSFQSKSFEVWGT